MNKYILAITREAIKQKEFSIDDFVENVKGVEDLVAPDSFGKRVQVEYSGTIGELYESLGYTPNQVHIEKYIEHNPLK